MDCLQKYDVRLPQLSDSIQVEYTKIIPACYNGMSSQPFGVMA